jgi:hypothetical protein
MDEDSNARGRAAEQAINEARADATAGRRLLRREQLRGGASRQTKIEAAEAAVALYDELKEHRDNTAVRERWEETRIDDLEDALGSTTYVPVDAPGDTSNQMLREVPAMQAVDAASIISIIDTLCELAVELGYGASTKDVTPSDEPELSDLRGLLKARGQTEALENLPDRADAEADS